MDTSYLPTPICVASAPRSALLAAIVFVLLQGVATWAHADPYRSVRMPEENVPSVDVPLQIYGAPVEAYTGGSRGLAFSPDGKHLARGFGSLVLLVDADTGTTERVVGSHRQKVLSVTFSSDGTQLLTSGEEGLAKLWDLASKRQLVTVAAQPIAVSALSPDARYIATGSTYGGTHLWDAGTGALVHDCTWISPGAVAVAFSPDSSRVAVSLIADIHQPIGSDTLLQLWDVEGGALYYVRKVKIPSSYLEGMVFGARGTQIHMASCPAQVWSSTGAFLYDFEFESTAVANTDTVDMTAYAGYTDDGTLEVRLFDTTHTLVKTLTHEDPLRFRLGASALAFSSTGDRLAALGLEDITIWNVESGEIVSAPFDAPEEAGEIEMVDLSADGTRALELTSVDEIPVVNVWDTSTGATLARIIPEFVSDRNNHITSVDMSADGKRVLLSLVDGRATRDERSRAELWDISTNTRLFTLHDVMESIHFLQWIEGEEKALLVYRRDGHDYFELWDLAAGRLEHTTPYQATLGAMTGQHMSADGSRFVTSVVADFSQDGAHWLSVWDTSTGTLLKQVELHDWDYAPDGFHNGSSGLAAMSRDGSRVAIHSGGTLVDGSVPIHVFEVASGTRLGRFTQSATSDAVAFTPDGNQLIIGGDTGWQHRNQAKVGIATLWSIDSGAKLLTFGGHTHSVCRVAISAEGTRLLTASKDGTCRLWSTHPTRFDSDGDGMPDDWETAYGFSPAEPADATEDPDGDGRHNLAEYNAGSSPTGPDSDGDVNSDGNTNAVDIQLVVNMVLGTAGTATGDVNGDNRVNAQDIQVVVNKVLGN